MDAYEVGLLREFTAAGVQIIERGSDALLDVEGGMTFNRGSAQPDPVVFRKLRAIGLILTHYQRHRIDVVGHTSSVEPEQLADWRASTASGILIGAGIWPGRIQASGRGDAEPVRSEASETTRSANQRVEIFLAPVT